MTVRLPSGLVEEVVRLVQGDLQSLQAVGILEVDDSLELVSLLDEVHVAALGSCHPMLLPVTLLEYHVRESASYFMTISKKLSNVEDAIDPSSAELSFTTLPTAPAFAESSRKSYGTLSKEVYECNKSLFELERRRDFEKRLQSFLMCNIRNYTSKGWETLESRLGNIHMVSVNRDLDMKSLPLRIEALTSLVSRKPTLHIMLQTCPHFDASIFLINMALDTESSGSTRQPSHHTNCKIHYAGKRSDDSTNEGDFKRQ
jgi:hypothetical protein